MITPSFGLTATERVLPKLALDFTTASLDPRVTFTRAGNTATVINSSGYVVPINADLPRFDYNPTTLVCNGLLIEESRTNLMTYSSDFADVSWIPLRSSVTSNATTAPDNTLTADKLVEDTTAVNSHQLYKGPFSTIGTYTITIFAKAGERSTLQIQQDNGGNSRFLLTGNGTATALGANTVSITPFGNGWYRCTTTFTSTGVFFVYLVLSDGASIFYTGNGTSGLFIWGAQVELASFPTSYIPTVATSVTRTADVATMTGTNFSSWYNQSQGAIYAETSSSNFAGDRGLYGIGNPALGFGSGEMMYAVYTSSQSGKIQFNVFDGGAQQSSLTPNTAQTINTFTQSVFAYKVNSNAASVSAIAPSTGAGSVPTPTAMSIGSLVSAWSGASQYLNGYVAKLSYYPQRLINNEVQAFSK